MSRSLIAFHPWPDDLATRYRALGYWLDKPLTCGVTEQAARQPDAVAVICKDQELSYGRLDSLSTTLAQRLTATGLGPGDTALVQLPNCAEFYIVFLALLKAGIVPVNALYSHRQTELSAYADQIRPRVLIADRGHALFRDDHFADQLDSGAQHRLVRLYLAGQGAQCLHQWMEVAPQNPVPLRTTPADQVAFFQLSGGSTGTPKLIPRTHNDYEYSVRASAEICALSPSTRFLCALPAPHNFLMSSPGALGVFHAGGTVVLAPNPSPDACFPLIARHHVTMAALTPSAVALWVQAAEATSPDLSALKLVQVGGASFAEATARKVPEVLGCALQQVFGMAEGLVNFTRLDDEDEVVFTTQGRPISPDDDIRVVDDSGQAVPPGQTGLLMVRGPYTFRGYYRSPAQNARTFDSDGFYASGDLVQRRADGNLRVVGRVKDQINRGGEKIAAEEIENLLLRHPDVQQAALVAVPDETLGEKSCAVVVGATGLRPVALRRHLVTLGVADFKVPDQFRFVDALPLTHVGKPDKRRLRAMMSPPSLADAP